MLNEGLSRHDLKHLVLPVISIDEYESKIDDRRVIVTGFYVRDYDPASDLSVFVEKSSIRPLDTEVSPAPTDDGWYMVFIEMGRDDDYPRRLLELLDQVGNLTDTTDWSFKSYGGKPEQLHKVTEENIREYTNLDPEKVEIEADEPEEEGLGEAIGSFLRNAMFESAEMEDGDVIIRDAGSVSRYRVVNFGDGSGSIPLFGASIGESAIGEAIRLQRSIGPGYSVEGGDGLLSISDGRNHLILAVDR